MKTTTLTLPHTSYFCLLNRVPRATAAHLALLKAGDPEGPNDKTAPRFQFHVECNIDTAGVLLQVAVQYCPAAVEAVRKCMADLLRSR